MKTLLAVLLLAGAGWGQADQPKTSTYSGTPELLEIRPSPYYLQINDPKTGELLVKITLETGLIEYGKNYHPDAAAKIFWEAVGKAGMCEVKQEAAQKRPNAAPRWWRF